MAPMPFTVFRLIKVLAAIIFQLDILVGGIVEILLLPKIGRELAASRQERNFRKLLNKQYERF